MQRGKPTRSNKSALTPYETIFCGQPFSCEYFADTPRPHAIHNKRLAPKIPMGEGDPAPKIRKLIGNLVKLPVLLRLQQNLHHTSIGESSPYGEK
jgi:hypothetical protein